MAKNDKYACFQWIRDVRSKMNEDTEDMTPEERVAYNRAGTEKALAAMPKLSLAEARRQRQAILASGNGVGAHPEVGSCHKCFQTTESDKAFGSCLMR